MRDKYLISTLDWVIKDLEGMILDVLADAPIGPFCDDAPNVHIDLEDDGEIAKLELVRRKFKRRLMKECNQ